jgi:hypothetical protein
MLVSAIIENCGGGGGGGVVTPGPDISPPDAKIESVKAKTTVADKRRTVFIMVLLQAIF